MKYTTHFSSNLTWIVFCVLIVTMNSCRKENEAPECEITSPVLETNYIIGNDVLISVDAEDPDGSIQEVRIYADNYCLSSHTGSPYTVTWQTGNMTSGTYVIKATAIDDRGEETSDQVSVNLIDGENLPVANFTGSPLSGTLPLEVIFTDLSDNAPTSWLWDFGDGSSSSDQNPSHTYSTSGEFTVSLTVSNTEGSNTMIKPCYVKTNEGGGAEIPIASFTADVTTGEAPLIVTFTDQSSNNPTDWLWNFGDGTTSTEQNPVHNYSSVGVFSVSLLAENEAGYDVHTANSYIIVSGSGSCPPFVTDIDGNVYSTTLIDSQCWMAENLKVTRYPNGEEIPNVVDDQDWSNLSDDNFDDAYCYYDNNPNSEYGALYTFAAAIARNWENDINSNQGICPNGWHIPTDSEWITLEGFVDSSFDSDDPIWTTDGMRGYDAGGMLKETGTTHWNSPNTGAYDSYSFTALPGGLRSNLNGGFESIMESAYFWSATQIYGTNGQYRCLTSGQMKIYRNSGYKSLGFSIRCVKD